jgi:hypothetical protein
MSLDLFAFGQNAESIMKMNFRELLYWSTYAKKIIKARNKK